MQPKLFEKSRESVDLETVILYALGDFQSRGKVLADRELAFDRLHGAFVRACTKFGIAELSDEMIVKGLRDLGATVTEVPNFVAKRPYRATVAMELAKKARELFEERQHSEPR